MRRLLKGLAAGLLTASAGVLLALTEAGNALERGVGLPWLFSVRGGIAAPQDVAVVAINGHTGDQLGLPSQPRDWSRTMHAQLIDELIRRGARAVIFDVQFDKPKVEAEDRIFAESIRRAGNVALVQLVTGKRQPIHDDSGRATAAVWMEELVQPLPMFVSAARGLATFPLPKIDAAVYEFWVFKESVGDAPTLPAVALQLHEIEVWPDWVQALRASGLPGMDALPETAATIDSADALRDAMGRMRAALADPQSAQALRAVLDAMPDAAQRNRLHALLGMYAGDPHRMLNFYGPPGSIQTVPYHEVIGREAGTSGSSRFDFRGRTVFVGFSDLYDPGHPDRFYTVFTNEDGVDLSGVEIAATAFSNLLTDRSLKMPDGLQTLLMLGAFGLLCGLAAYLLPATLGVPLVIAAGAAWAGAAQWTFGAHDLWLPLATPVLVQLPLALFAGLAGQYLLERNRGRRISKALGYYLPEAVARDLTAHQVDPHAYNKVVHGTCLATDMSGFSTISEQLAPDRLAVFLNDYFDTLATALKAHQVDITEFRADAIMCAWTGPRDDLVARRKAVHAALAAVDAIRTFRARHTLLSSSLRVGLAAGSFYVGHAGGGGHFVFSIVGDTANTASRVEGLNKHMGTSILATQAAIDGLDGFLMRPLGAFQFVGKSSGLPIFEILAPDDAATDADRRLCALFADALALCHAADWANAVAAFDAVLAEWPDDGPSQFYRARCQAWAAGATAPEDPRVTRMDVK